MMTKLSLIDSSSSSLKYSVKTSTILCRKSSISAALVLRLVRASRYRLECRIYRYYSSWALTCQPSLQAPTHIYAFVGETWWNSRALFFSFAQKYWKLFDCWHWNVSPVVSGKEGLASSVLSWGGEEEGHNSPCPSGPGRIQPMPCLRVADEGKELLLIMIPDLKHTTHCCIPEQRNNCSHSQEWIVIKLMPFRMCVCSIGRHTKQSCPLLSGGSLVEAITL